MTERKPPGVSFETWVDKQIREATERGGFENLPGAGKPIADLDKPYDEVWVTNHLRREGLSGEEILPTPLKLRKEVERLPETVRRLRSEQAVRAAVDELNQRINDWLRIPVGPPVRLAPVDADRIVDQWRADRAAAQQAAAAARESDAAQLRQAASERRSQWWRRIFRRRREAV
ncbi:DUF1992 domain-containing protein [Actinopolymorpha alba]|uniref:DnaJ family domain-containing protein n=1 Tax=Actinopolymorpha alba TaxID=533267 RepID=UPI0003820C09|nr:DUF1992 domain-containing protein [Actinopolymorpha alba]